MVRNELDIILKCLRCPNEAAKRRHICERCKSRQFTARNPLKRKWYDIRNSARRRGYIFSISFQEFTELPEIQKLLYKYRDKERCYTCDRIDNNKGYIVGNIQIITKCANRHKFWHDDCKVKEKIDYPF